MCLHNGISASGFYNLRFTSEKPCLHTENSQIKLMLLITSCQVVNVGRVVFTVFMLHSKLWHSETRTE